MTQLQFKCPLCSRRISASQIRAHRKHHLETGDCPPTQAEMRRRRKAAMAKAKPPRKPLSDHTPEDLEFIDTEWT